MKRLIIAVAFAFAASSGTAFAQHGHGSEILSSSSPADDSTVATPQALTLRFAEPLMLQSVALRTASGTTSVPFEAPTAAAATYTIPLPQLPAGRYELRWSATHDGETAEGYFHFAVR